METNALELVESSAGIVIRVQAQPGARRTGLIGLHAGRLKLAVVDAPENGKANQALTVLLAELLHVRRGQIELTGGATSRQKSFRIDGLTLAEIRKRVETALAGLKDA